MSLEIVTQRMKARVVQATARSILATAAWRALAGGLLAVGVYFLFRGTGEEAPRIHPHAPVTVPVRMPPDREY